MTSFYRFLLLRIEGASENPSGAAKIKRPPFWWSFYFASTPEFEPGCARAKRMANTRIHN